MSGILSAMASSSLTASLGRLGSSCLFLLPYHTITDASSICKRIDRYRLFKHENKNSLINQAFRKSAFTKVMVASAFAFTSNVNSLDLIPLKLKTAILSLSVFNRISQSSLGHFLTSPRALVLTPLVIELVQYVRSHYDAQQETHKETIACDLLGNVGHLFSCAALAKLTLVAFANIGTWKQTAVSVVLLGASSIAGAIIDDETTPTSAYLGLPVVVTVAFGILGKFVKQVSWVPQANINVATVIFGVWAFNAAHKELTACCKG